MASKFERAVVLIAMLAVCLTFIHARPSGVNIGCPVSGGSAPAGSATAVSATAVSATAGSAPSVTMPSGSAPSVTSPSGNTIQGIDYNTNIASAGDFSDINQSTQNLGVGGNSNAPIAGITG